MLLLEARDTLTRCLVMTRVKVKVKLKVSVYVLWVVIVATVMADVTCNATTLVGCFRSTLNVVLTLQHFVLRPSCFLATRLLTNNTVCYQIPLHQCRQLPAVVCDLTSFNRKLPGVGPKDP